MNRRIYLLMGLIFMLVFSCNQGKKSERPSIIESWYENIPQKTGYAFIINKSLDIKKFPSTIFNYYINKGDKDFLSRISFFSPYYVYIIQKDDKLKSFVGKGISSDFDKVFNEVDGIYNGVNIYKASTKSKDYYGIKQGEVSYVSDSRINLENVLRTNDKMLTPEEKNSFIETDRLLDHNADYNVVQLSKDLKTDVFNSSAFRIISKKIADYEAFDVVDLSKEIYTGIALSQEEKMMGIFKDISGVDHEIYKFLPEGFTEASRFSFDDFTGFYSGFTSYFNYKPLIKYTTKSLFHTLQSFTFFEENFNKAIILQFDDATDFIKANPYARVYNKYDIYEIKKPELLYDLFQPILKPFKGGFFTISDDYIIVTENKAYLKKLINDFENRNTLINRKDFENFSSLFPSGAQYEILQQKKVNHKKHYIYRNYTRDDDNVYVNLLLQEENLKKQQKGIEHLLTVSMDDTPIIKPQLVYNHKHKTYRIIYQNQNNELVYRDLSGRELWKKKYEDKIIGKIFPVDIYRNGKIQYAFVTKNKWYIIDRYGRNVEGFPVRFKNEITQSLSVFDYDKNRKYRFGIVQGNKFNLYDKEGKKIKGFDYNPNGEIIFPVTHYRIGSRDYILVQTDSKLFILDRRGGIRIPLDQKFENLRSNWKVYNRKFINISKQNEVYTIDQKGHFKKAQLGDGKPLQFNAISNLFAVVTDDKLILNGKTHEIELGSYHTPYIYKTKKGIVFIFLSRDDNNKIYAFDSKGKPVSFSPITGQQILDVKALGNKNYLMSYDSDHNLMIYRFK